MHFELKYRPEYRLDRLRMMRVLDSGDTTMREEGEPLLHLRWLRTIVVDLSHTPKSEADERLALQLRSAVGCAIERVVCKHVRDQQLTLLLVPLLKQPMLLLTSLDLRECQMLEIEDTLLRDVADAQSMSLRRLYLPRHCVVAQSTLERFTNLEELDLSGCYYVENVHFCSATLRVLYADYCSKLKDEGLSKATRLEVLHVQGCADVSDLSPFAHCLLELNASWPISSATLSECHRLQVLHASYHNAITTLQPFAERLRELDVSGRSGIDNAALADATGLVKLSTHHNLTITTVEPFGASLLRLDAGYSGIDDAGLVTATNLVFLNASGNTGISVISPFAGSLLELNASQGSGLSDDSLSAAAAATTNLMWFNGSYQNRITTVQSFGRTLRHFVSWGEEGEGRGGGFTNEGLATATQLVTFNCTRNGGLTTIEPFQRSLEELSTDSAVLIEGVAEREAHTVVHRVEQLALLLRDAAGAQLESCGFERKGKSVWTRSSYKQ